MDYRQHKIVIPVRGKTSAVRTVITGFLLGGVSHIAVQRGGIQAEGGGTTELRRQSDFGKAEAAGCHGAAYRREGSVQRKFPEIRGAHFSPLLKAKHHMNKMQPCEAWEL